MRIYPQLGPQDTEHPDMPDHPVAGHCDDRREANSMERSSGWAGKPRAISEAAVVRLDGDRRVQTPPVESHTPPEGGAEVMTVHIDTLKRHNIITADKSDPRTMAFDMLRTRVLGNMRKRGWATVAITSPTAGCGKSTVAVNMALGIAQQATPEVLLADLDLRRPKIARYLGIRPAHDFEEYLEGSVALPQIVVTPGSYGFLALANVRPLRKTTEILTNPTVMGRLNKLRSEAPGRVNIFDLPPLLTSDDVIAVLPVVDCVLLVVAEGLSKKAELKEAMRALADAEILGVVLNMSRVNERYYY